MIPISKWHLPFNAMIVLSILLSSCNRNALYSHSSPIPTNKSNEIIADSSVRRAEKILAPDDKLTLSIWGHDDLSVGSIHTIYNTQEEFGKWLMVDIEGEILLPQVGKLKVAGMTLPQATKAVSEKYARLIKDPQVSLRILNNQITVLGEVQKPGLYVFTNDNVRLADVLAKAQGLTDYAKTTKIRIVRNNQVYESDLTNIAYNVTVVLPGDVVYIPPSGKKGVDRLTNKLIPLASLLTALALVYNISNN
jgi:polysaccharide export outer membrane protein